MKRNAIYPLWIAVLLAAPVGVRAQQPEAPVGFEQASVRLERKLEEATREFNELQQRKAEILGPLNRQLDDLEAELRQARRENQEAHRLRTDSEQAVSNLKDEIKRREDMATYLADLMAEYIRGFEEQLHFSEHLRYEEPIDLAGKARGSATLNQNEVLDRQMAVLRTSVERLEDVKGGTAFEGEAVDAEGTVRSGRFLVIGPVGLFRSEDGRTVGTVQKGGAGIPSVVTFGREEDAEAAARLVRSGDGMLPLDTTGGNAHKIEATKQTIWEHVRQGGPVMVPILGMAGLVLLVALYKWIALTLVPKPSQKKIDALLREVARGDEPSIRQRVAEIKGPIGRMLRVGVDHLREPRELIEEVMYERVLSTRLKLQRLLPFVAIAAAAAPLLGLLGTVTGIINTFKLITVFGSGDVKMLSGGISEALITTEFGLIVAIPSLLLHAFLSRKAKGLSNEMEKAAVAFVNQVGKSRFAPVEAEPTEAEAVEPQHEGPEQTETETQESQADEDDEGDADLEGAVVGEDRE